MFRERKIKEVSDRLDGLPIIRLSLTRKFNIWYDCVQEPYRFLLAMGLFFIGIVLLNIPFLKFKIIGCVWFLLLFAVRIENDLPNRVRSYRR